MESLSVYLGISLIIAHRKLDAFEAVVNKTWKRVSGWKEKLLSIAGREMLIKAVLTAAPNYAMSCFRLLDRCSE